MMPQRRFRHTFDVLILIPTLVCLSTVLTILVLRTKIKLGLPPLFTQTRLDQTKQGLSLTQRVLKRLFELTLVIPALILFLPVLALIALLVRVKLGAPILFTQVRPGLQGKPFTLYKFRTMLETRDENGALLPDAQRLTKFGRFLRSTSLDELPELFNVLKGDMSLVGPRPLLLRYLPRYTAEQARRHEVRPGITGWAQINGRNAISWEDKFKLDVWYIDHYSLWLDLKIMLLTLWKVLHREGISQIGEATAAEFMGSKRSDSE